jgi:anti-sigma factor RsiW
MIKTFTHETLLRYVYNELPAKENHEIEQALLHDADLAAQCADLLEAQRYLDRLQNGPSNRVTENILQYSRTFLRPA